MQNEIKNKKQKNKPKRQQVFMIVCFLNSKELFFNSYNILFLSYTKTTYTQQQQLRHSKLFEI